MLNSYGTLVGHFLAKRNENIGFYGVDRLDDDVVLQNSTVGSWDQRKYEEQVMAWENSDGQVPVAGLVLLGFTILACTLFLISIRYTLWQVVSTLACVESPQSSLLVDDRKEESKSPNDPELIIVKHTPITSKIRKTIRHITSVGGFRARWRGAGMAVIYGLAYVVLKNVIAHALSIYFIADATPIRAMCVLAISGIMASIVLARQDMAWTHIVISNPSAKSLFDRVPPVKTWKKVWAASALHASADQFTRTVPFILFLALGLDDPQKARGLYEQLLGIAIIALMSAVGLSIPAGIALVRVQASLLPEEDETIVPFDRSFGGKVIPEIVGGSGCIGFVDAWKTFDPASRLRVFKLYIKIVGIEIALHLLFGLIIGLEAALVMTPSFKALLTAMHAQLTGRPW